MRNSKRPSRESGVSYMEVLVAVTIVGICLGPALDALSAGTLAAPLAAAGSRELACVRIQMEKVMAEPYSALLRAAVAAGKVSTATSYSVAADTRCPERRVYIGRYDPNSLGNPYVAADSGLLYVKTTTPEGEPRLVSLVARP